MGGRAAAFAPCWCGFPCGASGLDGSMELDSSEVLGIAYQPADIRGAQLGAG